MRLTPILVLLFAAVAHAEPARPLDLIGKLDPAGKAVPLGAAERKLLTDARGGKLRSWTLEEAALVASGVHDGRRRKEYLATFEDLATAASRAVAEAKTPRDRGDALLRFLHAGPLKSYSRYQTALDRLFDDGTFNCVSSVVLYNALAARLGLDVRGVVIPRHAFSALSDEAGKVDVETTAAEGFDPVRRKRRVVVVHRDGLIDLGMRDPSRLFRREVRDAGLAALIYSNRAAASARDGNHLAGALLGLRALCLDRDSPGAGVNTRVNLGRWAARCAETGRFEAGLQAVGVGLALDPKCPSMLKARLAIYQGWGAGLLRTRPDAAVEVLVRGVRHHPELGKELTAAIERGARQALNRSGPVEARAFLARSLRKAATVEGVQLAAVNYVSSLSRALAGKGEFARAVSAVADHAALLGKTDREGKARAESLTREVYQAWGRALTERKDWDAAARVYREALTLFPGDAAFKSAVDRVRAMRRTG